MLKINLKIMCRALLRQRQKVKLTVI